MILPTKLGPFPVGNSLLRSPVKQSHASARYNLQTELFSVPYAFVRPLAILARFLQECGEALTGIGSSRNARSSSSPFLGL